jgi:hypothetical protein
LPANGLSKAIIRRGRSVRVNEQLFLDWWKNNDGGKVIEDRDSTVNKT